MYVVHVIEVRERGEGGVLIELRGEFDGHNLEDLRRILDSVLALRRPTMVDLSGVTFLDIGATRELMVRSRVYAHHLLFRNPSPQVRASVAACGFEEWFHFRSDPEDTSCRRAYVQKRGGRMASSLSVARFSRLRNLANRILRSPRGRRLRSWSVDRSRGDG